MTINVSNVLSAYQNVGKRGIDGPGLAAVSDSKGQDFGSVMKDFMSDAVESVKAGEEMAVKGAMGKADLQEVILAVSNAEVMVQTITSIRDKVITAYQEVIRTSI
ncbi:MAG: flagellar hook-basal body complex protein FliE [Proteobacteria bacterium]|jgi:flagellar hook-basal body complex protein FliE|nr:flagellar hook-basal body complex protein FliE [Alphaproteobacteria bacterium]NCC03765.1 flagellar hook-basal body complex protein FliE [Pseudomonadota bacterium]